MDIEYRTLSDVTSADATVSTLKVFTVEDGRA
jgi:hypothetical protein